MGEKAIKGKAIMRKVLSCLVVIVFLMSTFSAAGVALSNESLTAGNNSIVPINDSVKFVNESADLFNESASGVNKVSISESQDRTGDLTVYVYNINLNPLPASGGQIRVSLSHDVSYEEIDTQTKDFDGGSDFVQITFHNIPISEVIPNRFYQYYTIDVFEQPNSDYEMAQEYWGSCRHLNIQEGDNERVFIRDMPWISDVKINGMNPTTNDINVPLSTSVGVDITIHNSCEETRSVIAGLFLDRDKGVDQTWDIAKRSEDVDIEGYEDYTFHFDCTPNDDGTYYFKVIAYCYTTHIFFIYHYTPTDQWEWSKGFEVSTAGDIWEPDNSYQQANWIATDGTHQTHNIEPAGDHDWVKFNAVSGTEYTIETSNLGSESDTFIYLYDRDGITEITQNDDYSGLASRIVWTCSTSGTYYVMIRHYDSSSHGSDTQFDISITAGGVPPTPPPPTPPPSGDIWEPDNSYQQANGIATDGTHQTHNIEPAGDHDWVKFNAVSAFS